MILIIGSSADKVHPQLIKELNQSGQPYVVVDEDVPAGWEVVAEHGQGPPTFRIYGGNCKGTRPVHSIFVRHAVARTLDPDHLHRLGQLQTNLNRLLAHTACPTINSPACAFSNYSKPYQVGLLAAAGFDVPHSLVTNDPARAKKFYKHCHGRVIYKGVSNVMTLAQRLSVQSLDRLSLLPHSPTLFQEYIEGDDFRVHVIGKRTFVTQLRARNEDYRRSALVNDEEIDVRPARLPQAVLTRCVAVTRQLGLIVGGIDFKQSRRGRLVVLELNPYPQFTFYEGRSGQPITKAVVAYLVNHQVARSNVFV
jgi:glutathione synthase/RimK-type ligase-like ATP-grasp enzyme